MGSSALMGLSIGGGGFGIFFCLSGPTQQVIWTVSGEASREIYLMFLWEEGIEIMGMELLTPPV